MVQLHIVLQAYSRLRGTATAGCIAQARRTQIMTELLNSDWSNRAFPAPHPPVPAPAVFRRQMVGDNDCKVRLLLALYGMVGSVSDSGRLETKSRMNKTNLTRTKTRAIQNQGLGLQKFPFSVNTR